MPAIHPRVAYVADTHRTHPEPDACSKCLAELVTRRLTAIAPLTQPENNILPPLSFARVNLRFNSANVRVLHCLPIDAMLVDGHFCPPANIVFSAEFASIREALQGQISAFSTMPMTTLPGLEALFVELALSIPVGFLFKAEQPYLLIEGAERLSYSWDFTRSRRFYGLSYAAGLDAVYQWASKNHEEALERSRLRLPQQRRP